MKILLVAATALTMTGTALAYQYATQPTTTTGATMGHEAHGAMTIPANWTAGQRALWEEQMRYHPGWTPAQVAAFEAMMAIPPEDWTAEQRALYAEHMTHIPSHWTQEQRATFAEQIAVMSTPWVAATQTAEVDQGPVTYPATTTTAMAPASLAVVQPSNANPEEDARGIPVISDVAYVPPGYNGIGGAMGGPLEGDDEGYPPCTRERTDNCLQTYEVGNNPD